MRLVIGLVGLVAVALLANDAPLWIVVPIGFGLVLLLNALADAAFGRAVVADGRTRGVAWIAVWAVVAILGMAFLAAMTDTLTPKPPLPWPAGTP